MNRLLAQTSLGNIDGIGPLGNFDKSSYSQYGALMTFESFISMLIGFLTVVAGLWFFYQIILSGLSWIGAGGDKATLQTAQKRLTMSVLGLIIVVAAYTLIGLIGNLLGLDIYNLWETIYYLAPDSGT